MNFSRLAKRLQNRLWDEARREDGEEESLGHERADEGQPSKEVRKEEEEDKKGEGEKGERNRREEEGHDIKVIKFVIYMVY